MKQDPINDEVSQRICNHMNHDHKDSLRAYARFYGGLDQVNDVKLLKISDTFMKILVDEKDIEIYFDHTLKDSSDAHQTLISMLKKIPKKMLST